LLRAKPAPDATARACTMPVERMVKAMLLAAGRGERMRPLTDDTPKPLLAVGGKPLIVWHIEKLAHAGIRDIVINHAHLGEKIKTALGDGKQFGAHLQYSWEARALETAGGIANALPLLGGDPFAVINSDIFCDYDFANLREGAVRLLAANDDAHLVLVDNPPHNPSGDFVLHEGRVWNHTPPNPKFRGLQLTFSGIGIYRPRLFSGIPAGTVAPLAPILRAQIRLGKVSGEHYKGNWVDVGTPQRLLELDMQIRSLQNGQ
jgi:MurNAc alpha-1-phosphate uridylyltransferase